MGFNPGEWIKEVSSAYATQHGALKEPSPQAVANLLWSASGTGHAPIAVSLYIPRALDAHLYI